MKGECFTQGCDTPVWISCEPCEEWFCAMHVMMVRVLRHREPYPVVMCEECADASV